MGIERFKVRVHPGFNIQGFSNAGAPAALQPGEYVVHWLATNRAGSQELESALRFLGAHEDRSGDDVNLFRADWPAFHDWPDLPSDSPFQLLA